MKKLDIIFKTLMSLTIVIFITSCEIDSFAESDEHSFGEIIAPSNVQITANVVGQDADNPNGDGSGEVEFTVKLIMQFLISLFIMEWSNYRLMVQQQ